MGERQAMASPPLSLTALRSLLIEASPILRGDLGVSLKIPAAKSTRRPFPLLNNGAFCTMTMVQRIAEGPLPASQAFQKTRRSPPKNQRFQATFLYLFVKDSTPQEDCQEVIAKKAQTFSLGDFPSNSPLTREYHRKFPSILTPPPAWKPRFHRKTAPPRRFSASLWPGASLL